MKEHYDEKNKGTGNDLASQTRDIRDGKIQLPEQFKGKLVNKPPKY